MLRRDTHHALCVNRDSMRIATYNMRYGSAYQWYALLDAFEPDVIFAQETRNPAGFTSDLLRDLSGAVWTPAAHGKWGSALWVRDGAIEPVLGMCGGSWWAAGGLITAGGQRVLACSVHTAQAGGSYIKSTDAFLDALGAVRREHGADLRIVLGGDWNHSASDRWSGDERRNNAAETKVLARLHDEFGLRSAWSIARPDTSLPQTLRWTNAPAIPFHVDGVFLPVEWANRVQDVHVEAGEEWKVRSDHNPVIVTLGDD